MASRYNPPSRSSLFLLELIISIFFFSIAAAVCIRLYVGAHRVSLRSQQTSAAVSFAQGAAECFLAADDPGRDFLPLLKLAYEDSAGAMDAASGIRYAIRPEKGSSFLPADLPDGKVLGQYRADTDADWYALCTVVRLTDQKTPGLCQLCIRVLDEDGKSVYDLDVRQYHPEKEE